MYKIAIFQKTLNEFFEIFNCTNYKYQSLHNLFLTEHLFNNKQVSICFILYDSHICDAFNARIKANHEYHYFRLYINLGHVLILSLLTCQCSLQGKNPLIYKEIQRRFFKLFLNIIKTIISHM